MKALHFIRYFFYIAFNWNIRIALHILVHEVKGEKKYGIDTTGADELQSLEEKGIDTSRATIYMPASYDMLEDIFVFLSKESLLHFVDIGCGKGRALCVAAAHGIPQVTGVDFSKEFCIQAESNLKIVQQKFPDFKYTVQNNDAFYFDIPDSADCIFLFNPFDETTMTAVLENIEDSSDRRARRITIVYLNPLNKSLFTDAGFKQIKEFKKMNYLEACILQRA